MSNIPLWEDRRVARGMRVQLDLPDEADIAFEVDPLAGVAVRFQ